MARDTIESASRGGSEIVIAYDPTPEFPTPDWAAPGRPFFHQGEGDLGRRLERAFEEGFRRGRPVLAVGTDSPTLPPETMAQALAALDRVEVVWGPAQDGGYYLIGLARESSPLFRGIPWSTPGVLAATRRAAESAGLRAVELPPVRDVDTPEDLAWLARELAERPASVAPATRRALKELRSLS